jgi:hypothetical protein
MSSEARCLSLIVLALVSAPGCADFERGPAPPVPEAGPEVPTVDGGGVSFATVRPLLDDGCRRCHSAMGMAASSMFLLTGDATAEYTAARSIVDPSAPAQSRMLAKASGQGHQGGTIYRPGSAEYAALLAWIQGGASP